MRPARSLLSLRLDLLAAAAIAVPTALVSTTASAQPAPDPDGAAKLFEAASTARDNKDYATCVAKSEEAWAKFQHAQIRGLEGLCEYELGKYRDAATHLAFYVNGTASASDEMKKGFEKARQRVGEVVLSCNIPGAKIAIDGKPVDPDTPSVFLDPGEHSAEATKDGYLPGKEERSIAAGVKVDVHINLEINNGSGTPGGGGSHPSLAPAIVAYVLGAVGFGVGGGLYAVGSSKLGDATTQGNGVKCIKAALDTKCSGIADDVSSGDTFENASIGGFVVGGVGVAAGTGLLIWALTSGGHHADKPGQEHAWSVAPIIGRDTQGVVVGGRF